MSWPEPVQRVADVLLASATDSRIEEFSEGAATAREAARAIGCDLSQIVKSIVLVCDGAYVLALVPGDRRVSEQAVAEAVTARSVRVASAEEVTLATGFEPGAVAPFPRRAVRDTLMETSFFAHETVWIGAGSSAHMASLRPGELQRLAGARAVDLIGPG